MGTITANRGRIGKGAPTPTATNWIAVAPTIDPATGRHAIISVIAIPIATAGGRNRLGTTVRENMPIVHRDARLDMGAQAAQPMALGLKPTGGLNATGTLWREMIAEGDAATIRTVPDPAAAIGMVTEGSGSFKWVS